MANKTNFTVNGKEYFKITYDVGVNANGKRIRKVFMEKIKKKLSKKTGLY